MIPATGLSGVTATPVEPAPMPGENAIRIAMGSALDVICLSLALVLFAHLVFDVSTPARPAVALCFFVFVPGWVFARNLGAHMNGATIAISFVLSITVAIVAGELLVLGIGWHWFTTSLVLTGSCSVLAIVNIVTGKHDAARLCGFASVLPLTVAVVTTLFTRNIFPEPARGGPGPRLAWWLATAMLASIVATSTDRACRRLFRLPTASVSDRVRRTLADRAAVTCVGISATGCVFTILGLSRSSTDPTSQIGLLGALSLWWWVGTGVLIVSIAVGCALHTRWAWAGVIPLVAALHGAPGLLEQHPRFAPAWVHVGFIEHIAVHGTLLNIDARFRWAGFFAAGALLQRVAGTDDVLWMVRFAPVFYNAVAILLVVVLARRLGATKEQRIVAAATFCCLNWVGQDYFSPQAVGSILYLGLMVILVYTFPTDDDRGRSSHLRWLRPEIYPRHRQELGKNATVAILCVGVLLLAMVSSHQLTPIFAVTAMAGLALVSEIKLRLMWVFCVVALLAWLSFAAQPYWIGHLNVIFGSVGEVKSIAEANVTSRTPGASSSVERSLVLYSRIILALVTWVGAVAVGVVMWVKRRTPLVLIVLFFAPFPMLLLQPYGGEMALRVCFFTLAPSAILLSRVAAPSHRNMTARRAGALAVIGLLLLPLFVTARFGNEAFEHFSTADIDLLRHLYEIAPDGSTVFVSNEQTPLYVTRVSEVRFRTLPEGGADDSINELDRAAADGAVFVLLTQSQRAYGVITLGRGDDWMRQLLADLQQTGRFRVSAQAGDGIILRLIDAR